MKVRHYLFTLAVLIFLGGAVSAQACEIEFKPVDENKTVYHKDDIVILKVTVFLTHRNCKEGINATKFKGDGMKLLGAKKWEQVTRLKYTRLVKVQVIGNEKGEAVLHASRTCNKEGGHGVFKVKVQ